MTRTAVILAAGMGTRLRSVVGFRPKGLLPWEGGTLIGRSLGLLAGAGITRVVMAVGFESDQYRRSLEGAPIPVEYVLNPHFARTGSMHSLSLCRKKIDGDFLLLESDLLYERRALETLLGSPEPDLVLLSGPTKAGDEVFVYGTDGMIQAVSKSPLGLPLLGELVGISKISRTLLGLMCRRYASITLDPKYDYEHCLADVGRLHPVRTVKVEDLAWAEIDGPEHLERAERVVGPRLGAVG
ncbi:MAG: phosphocholine cytidylyltransferase family protein [Candidatus Aminicenantes bacterium]|nr:phosphocholine cytidylyltransferase family protein [Candidatus Aminicenantes bacterium]